eukprot:8634040-Lingulodinium_polyedra.AAC.1
MDEEDLREKYQKKPKQLQAILETTETRVHPIRKCKMYADLKVTSSFFHMHAESHESKRQLTSSEKVAGAKK